MLCDAGKGCAIDCPGDCVARWDDLNLCETRCLGNYKTIRPMKLAEVFSLSIHASNGRQVKALFDQYLPKELSRGLDYHDDPIDIELSNATSDDLVAELRQLMGGLKTV